jgi:hypothetical protein
VEEDGRRSTRGGRRPAGGAMAGTGSQKGDGRPATLAWSRPTGGAMAGMG